MPNLSHTVGTNHQQSSTFIGRPAAHGVKYGWKFIKKSFRLGKYAPNPNAIKSASHGVAMGAAAARKAPPAKPIASPGCFLAGTLVLTGAGPLPIEAIEPGDCVWSHDLESSEWELCEVEATQQREYFGDVVTLTLQIGELDIDPGNWQETISCTGGHPFWVAEGEGLEDRPACVELPLEDSQVILDAAGKASGRWTEARWLRLGDKFLTRTGVSATVVGLTIRVERVKVYNLQVRDLELYAVGDGGVLVHNSTITTNSAKGNSYRSYLAEKLKAKGLQIAEVEWFWTPLGPRVVDILIYKNGLPWYRIETKTGKSRYTPWQRAKDYYLEHMRQLPGCMIRDPTWPK